MDKRVAIFFAEGTEECEALVVCDVLRRAHISTDLVSITASKQVTSSHGVGITCDTTLADCGLDAYDLLVLPGGIPGTPHLHENSQLMKALHAHNQAGKLLGAICAAPSIFAEEGFLQDKRATSNPGFQHVLTEHGAYVEPNSSVVRDGNIITSQGLGTALDFSYMLIAALDDTYDLEALRAQVVDMR